MTKKPIIHLHHGDLPEGITFGNCVAIDTETLGLNPLRDKLCLVQMSAGDGTCHMVKFDISKPYNAPNLTKLLANKKVTKIFHYARFDVAVLFHYLNVIPKPIYCTKVTSKLTRTYVQRHGLKDLCSHLLSVSLDKQQQTSDWASETLSEEQLIYAANDVLYLHRLKEALDKNLKRDGRTDVARACFEFLPTCAKLDLAGWDTGELFSHS